MVANGHKVSRPLRPGIYAPIPTFFKAGSEDLGVLLAVRGERS